MTKEGQLCFSKSTHRSAKITGEPVNDPAYLRRKRLVSLFSLIVFLVLSVAFAATAGQKMIEFISDGKAFQQWVEQQGILGPLALIGIMTLQVVVAIIPGEVVEIGAGYAFGAVEGMFLCLIGAAISSAIIYGFTKWFGIRMVETFVSREKIQSLRFLQDANRLNLLIFILFFIPGSPKDILTYLVGLTPMKLRTFLILSSIARIPSVITSTIGGEALGAQNYSFAVLVFVVTGAISAAGLLLYQRITLQKQKEGK